MKSLAELAAIAQEISEMEEQSLLSDAELNELLEMRKDVGAHIAQKVDRCVNYLEALEARSIHLSTIQSRIDIQHRATVNAHKRMKEYLVKVLEDYPHITFKSDTAKLRLQKNSQPSAEWKLPIVDYKGKKYVRFGDVKHLLDIKPYLGEVESMISIDTEAVKKALEGQDHELVSVKRGYHLRIR